MKVKNEKLKIGKWRIINDNWKIKKNFYVQAIPDLIWVDFLIRPRGSCGGMT